MVKVLVTGKPRLVTSDSPTLAERSALSGVGRERAAGARHCWVSGLPGDPGR